MLLCLGAMAAVFSGNSHCRSKPILPQSCSYLLILSWFQQPLLSSSSCFQVPQQSVPQTVVTSISSYFEAKLTSMMNWTFSIPAPEFWSTILLAKHSWFWHFTSRLRPFCFGMLLVVGFCVLLGPAILCFCSFCSCC